MSAVYEFEANRYARLGDMAKAGEFKAAAYLAARSLLEQFDAYPGHIKNSFDPDSKLGCEPYGYFLKYMISVASYAYNAYIYADDAIPATVCPAETGGYMRQTDDDFHKIIVNSCGYYLEFDINADFHYDANGLGRVHKKDVPSPLCLSVPFVREPSYKAETPNACDATICCYIDDGTSIRTGAEKGVRYTKIADEICDDGISLSLQCELTDGTVIDERYHVTADGIDMNILGAADAGILFPAFAFDGAEKTEITVGDRQLTVRYRGHICRYTFDGELCEMDTLFNRNGFYKLFKMQGHHLHIDME